MNFYAAGHTRRGRSRKVSAPNRIIDSVICEYAHGHFPKAKFGITRFKRLGFLQSASANFGLANPTGGMINMIHLSKAAKLSHEWGPALHPAHHLALSSLHPELRDVEELLAERGIG